jgi:hypothetical protein
MPRLARLDTPGTLHHVIVRGSRSAGSWTTQRRRHKIFPFLHAASGEVIPQAVNRLGCTPSQSQSVGPVLFFKKTVL